MTITIKYLSHENKLTPVDRLDDIPDTAQFVWCDLNQPTDAENNFLQTYFNFNKLEIDDTVNGTPRAKYKIYDSYQYIVIHGLNRKTFNTKALNLFIKDRLLITYHHQPFNVLKQVEENIKERALGGLQLEEIVMSILDYVVDSYFELVYDIEDKVYAFEDRQAHYDSMKTDG